MDAPGLDAQTYRAVLADLAKVNTLTMARGPTLRFLAAATRGRRHFRLLDVGFGQGDMLRTIAAWAARRGLAAELTGVDLNAGSAAAAAASTSPDLPITYLTGNYADLSGGGFDVIVSSLVAHHMDDLELVAFLRFMEREAQTGWMINDILRHRLAYAAFPLLARLMGWHRIVREDGTLSIARGFRPDEWPPLLEAAGLAPATARIVRRFPFRLCIERLR
jgi:2-polyprenyl-3-methyl-5-hydroxy-6-metoxy-1,4-benzoquinol methylase